MTLRERLEADMKEALKAREAGRLRLSVVRLVRAGVRNAEIERGKVELDDAGVAAVVRREIKQREEVLPDYERAGRMDDVERIRAELAILREYLPAAASEEEIRRVVDEVAVEVGATGPRDMGAVMKGALARLAGRAEGAEVRRAVEARLRSG
ncbi:MAG: GatB/YqeY domain-containing protein [Firmicutes bacterium]|nr:GatB/YqeY domain-containing protein [Bacillota bacterium]